jgi:CMP-N,N'-diacetyllegionaminic acid synthase
MYKGKKILGVITARGGSKGIPGKNIKKLGGKPLLTYSIESAKKSRLITHLIVSTDSKKIASVAKQSGANVPFLRPAKLATDTAGHLEVMQHATKFMEDELGFKFDYVVIFQPTSPFRTVSDIDDTVKKLIDRKADSAVSLVEIENNHPAKIKKMVGDRVLPYCVQEKEGIRRQDLPKAYRRSGAVYAMRRDLIMKKNKLYGDYIVGQVVPKDRSIDIDNGFDWLKAEYMLKQLRKNGYDL